MHELSEREFKITRINMLRALALKGRQYGRLENYSHQRDGNYKNGLNGNGRNEKQAKIFIEVESL